MLNLNALPPKNAPHLRYLDGLRGLAALYIVLFHCQMHLRSHTPEPLMPFWLHPLLDLISYGHAAVCIFIVLSGYVLMLPVVRAGDKGLRGGVGGFLKRRAKRILPTYYAALLTFSGLLLVTQYLPTSEGTFHRRLSLVSFLEHVFLVHNWDAARWFDIDGPMWSLATEWQIYFLFALVLLPLYRRVGLLWTVLFAGLLSLLPHFILPAATNGDQAAPWFLLLFALGMTAARFNFAPDAESRAAGKTVPWGTVAVVVYGVFLILLQPWLPAPLPAFLMQNSWLPDVFCGLATAALLVFCTNALQKTPEGHAPNAVVRLLQSRFLVGMGAFSYSLYLIHQPLVGLVVQTLQWKRLHVPPTIIWFGGFALLPLVVGAGYLFYLLFERPFVGTSANQAPSFLNRFSRSHTQTDPT